MYIGQTNNIKRRMNTHLSKRNYSNAKLYNSIREYGWNNHIHGVIEYTDNKDERECYWIEQFDSYANGLNSIAGGGVYPVLRGKEHPLYGVGHTDETRMKISENHAPCSGSDNANSKNCVIIFEDGSKEYTDCLKVWCRERGYNHGSHRNRIEGTVGTYHKKPTNPHPKSGVVKIIKL